MFSVGDGVQGSGASLQILSIPFTSHTQRATPIPFFFCLTCCHCVSVQERVPQLYVHFPVCRESSCNNVRPGSSPAPTTPSHHIALLVQAGGEVASLCWCVSILSSLGAEEREWDHTSLRIPALIPSAGAQGSVGEPELYACVCLSIRPQFREHFLLRDSSEELQRLWDGAKVLTWRQGAKSSPLAMMHLW